MAGTATPTKRRGMIKSKPSNGQSKKIQTVNEAGELALLDPRKIKVIEELLTRRKHSNKDEIEALAENIEKNGQDTPISVRLMDNGEYQLLAGWTRLQAGKKIAARKAGWTIRAQVLQGITDEEAVNIGIRENALRKNTSPVDDAFNQQKLREQFKYNDRQIAKVYAATGKHVTPAWVGQLKKLMSLDPKVLDKVHSGHLPVSAALDMADLAPAEQVQVSEAVDSELASDPDAKSKDKKAKRRLAKKAGSKVREKVRAKKGSIEDTVTPSDEVEDSPAPQRSKSGKSSIARTLPEVRAFFEMLTGPAEPKGLRTVSKFFLLYASGRKSDKSFEGVLRKYTSEPSEDYGTTGSPTE